MVFTDLDPSRLSWLTIWFVVDGKGKVQNLRVLRSSGKASYENSLNAVRRWQFKTGTCDGKPIAMPLTMEIPATPR